MVIEATHEQDSLTALRIEGSEWDLRQLAMRIIEAAAEGKARASVGDTDIKIRCTS